MKKKFLLKEIVWAKLSGYPWWPGYIKSIKGEKFEVYFFGDFSRAYFKKKNLRKFNEIIFKNLKNIILKEAIEIANRVHGDVTTFETELFNFENHIVFKNIKKNEKSKNLNTVETKKKPMIEQTDKKKIPEKKIEKKDLIKNEKKEIVKNEKKATTKNEKQNSEKLEKSSIKNNKDDSIITKKKELNKNVKIIQEKENAENLEMPQKYKELEVKELKINNIEKKLDDLIILILKNSKIKEKMNLIKDLEIIFKKLFKINSFQLYTTRIGKKLQIIYENISDKKINGFIKKKIEKLKNKILLKFFTSDNYGNDRVTNDFYEDSISLNNLQNSNFTEEEESVLIGENIQKKIRKKNRRKNVNSDFIEESDDNKKLNKEEGDLIQKKLNDNLKKKEDDSKNILDGKILKKEANLDKLEEENLDKLEEENLDKLEENLDKLEEENLEKLEEKFNNKKIKFRTIKKLTRIIYNFEGKEKVSKKECEKIASKLETFINNKMNFMEEHNYKTFFFEIMQCFKTNQIIVKNLIKNRNKKFEDDRYFNFYKKYFK